MGNDRFNTHLSIHTSSPTMPSSRRVARPAMYNTPHIRNGGFGALQVEALTNRPLSIARRHLAASQLRMRHIEPDELSSSEWVRFLVMSDNERERWMTIFQRRRRKRPSLPMPGGMCEAHRLPYKAPPPLYLQHQGGPAEPQLLRSWQGFLMRRRVQRPVPIRDPRGHDT